MNLSELQHIASKHLPGVLVEYAPLPAGYAGMANFDGRRRRIQLKPELRNADDDKQLEVLCHEIAHHTLNHIAPKAADPVDAWMQEQASKADDFRMWLRANGKLKSIQTMDEWRWTRVAVNMHAHSAGYSEREQEAQRLGLELKRLHQLEQRIDTLSETIERIKELWQRN